MLKDHKPQSIVLVLSSRPELWVITAALPWESSSLFGRPGCCRSSGTEASGRFVRQRRCSIWLGEASIARSGGAVKACSLCREAGLGGSATLPMRSTVHGFICLKRGSLVG